MRIFLGTSPRKLLYTTSETLTKSSKTARPAGVFKLIEIDRLLRLKDSKNKESSPSEYGGTYLPTSPPTDGSSTLITSAPKSAK